MRVRRRNILLGLLGLFLMSQSFAQKYDVKTYSVNEGMPTGQVFDVAYDEQGFVWFATISGLVKSDGRTFTHYDSNHGLRDDYIYDVFVDSKNNLWVSTSVGGVGLFKKDTLIYTSEFSRLSDIPVTFITENKYGDILFATEEEGVFKFDSKSNKLERFAPTKGLEDKTVWQIYFDSKNNTWLSTQKGLVVLDNQLNLIYSLDEENGLNGYAAYQVYEAENGDVWVASSYGVNVISSDFQNRKISEVDGKSLGFVFSVSGDSEGKIWIGTEENGLYWHTDREGFTHITKDNGLQNNYINNLVKSPNGEVWVITDGNGVVLFKDSRINIFDKDSGLGAKEVFEIYKEKNGTLWFTTEMGLSSFKNDEFTNYKFPANLVNPMVWEIDQLKDGHLLLLTDNYELLSFKNGRFNIIELPKEISDSYPRDLLVIEDEILIGTENGLFKYDWKRVKSIPLESESEDQEYINTIYKDQIGDIWLGTEDGIINLHKNSIRRYNSENGVEGKSITEITEDRIGNIWVGTNKGISVLTDQNDDENSKLASSFKLNEMYFSETMFLQFDALGGLWQGTNGGLNYYSFHQWDDSDEMKSIHFPLIEYGKGIEFNGSASEIDEEGRIWFGTSDNGLVTFKRRESSDFITGDEPPAIFIRSLTNGGELVYDQNSEKETPFEFSYEQNNVEIKFSGVEFKDPNRLLYRYRLIGLEESWNTGYNISQANYFNLKHGNYTFEVAVKSTNSRWSSDPAKISFQINKPFWNTIWFYLGLIILVLSTIAFYIKVRVEVLEKKKLQHLVNAQTSDLQEALDEKEVLIKEIHHRVKNNLAVVSGLLEMQSWDLKEGQAKQALEESKLRVLAMSKVHENLYQNKDLARIDFGKFLEELVEGIVSTLHKTSKNITVKTETDHTFVNVNMGIPCGLIINELITNSYKHAFKDREEGEIHIFFHTFEKHHQIIVQDNGVGAPVDILNSSSSALGMTLINSLVTQLNSEITYQYKEGSYFQINIPRKDLPIT